MFSRWFSIAGKHGSCSKTNRSITSSDWWQPTCSQESHREHCVIITCVDAIGAGTSCCLQPWNGKNTLQSFLFSKFPYSDFQEIFTSYNDFSFTLDFVNCFYKLYARILAWFICHYRLYHSTRITTLRSAFILSDIKVFAVTLPYLLIEPSAFTLALLSTMVPVHWSVLHILF